MALHKVNSSLKQEFLFHKVNFLADCEVPPAPTGTLLFGALAINIV